MSKPKAKFNYVKQITLEELQAKYTDFFQFKFEDGIMELKMHSDGGHVRWSTQMHNALGEVWTDIGHAKWIECLIITCADPYWILADETDPGSWAEMEQSEDMHLRYDVQIYDTLKLVENFVNDIEIPTIAAINGRGIHWEMGIMSDITLCTPDFIFQDDHFGMQTGMVPGDSQTMVMQMVLGIKRSNYMSLTCKGLNAQECLDLGVVNEIVERDKIVDRAWEIARKYIMTRDRSVRRMTHFICVRKWREFVEQDLRIHVLSEMYSFNLSGVSHNFNYIDYEGDSYAEKIEKE